MNLKLPPPEVVFVGSFVDVFQSTDGLFMFVFSDVAFSIIVVDFQDSLDVFLLLWLFDLRLFVLIVNIVVSVVTHDARIRL